ncbi:DUF547 domain-containing protein [Lacinutrix neustonica]|uniref:DUF547 domain-containing protein n=1 Tax=Lacinutrix neustonica TaxID=2980107 RepID=A0A9E8MU54_9FLAO|nr:DUF547 domain-containing protein [Lacinutrix neustonica]WAC01406.1 DUF547 domain-containing protein [Lacinutrix neustonica]
MDVKKTTIVMVMLLLFGSFSSKAQNLDVFLNKADAFFKVYVFEGKVDYHRIKIDQTVLNDVLKIAKGIDLEKENAANYQAFWINAYNLAVIKGITDSYPIQSPLDVVGFFDESTYQLAGKSLTLNTIENQELRSRFKDARFHFVLVCGAMGCPPLISAAYLPSTLESQLELQTRKALNGSFLKVDTKKKKWKVHKY